MVHAAAVDVPAVVGLVGGAGPVAAEGEVEDHLLVGEVRGNVAARIEGEFS